MTTCNICGGLLNFPHGMIAGRLCECRTASSTTGTTVYPHVVAQPPAPELELELQEMRDFANSTANTKFKWNTFRLIEIVDELRREVKNEWTKAMNWESHSKELFSQLTSANQTIDDLRSKIDVLRSQRDHFKFIAESAVATVKEQEERIKRYESQS